MFRLCVENSPFVVAMSTRTDNVPHQAPCDGSMCVQETAAGRDAAALGGAIQETEREKQVRLGLITPFQNLPGFSRGVVRRTGVMHLLSVLAPPIPQSYAVTDSWEAFNWFRSLDGVPRHGAVLHALAVASVHHTVDICLLCHAQEQHRVLDHSTMHCHVVNFCCRFTEPEVCRILHAA